MRRPTRNFGPMITILAVGLCARPVVAQQSISATTSDGGALNQSVVQFHDEFDGPALDSSRWQPAEGVAIVRDPTRRERMALRLARERQGAASRPVVLTSVAIDLAGAPGAEIAYALLPNQVEVGESLLVEYYSQGGSWTLVERVVVSPGGNTRFSNHRHILPSDALHGNLRVRFSTVLNDLDDAWYLRDVSIMRRKPECDLAIRSHPLSGVLCAIGRDDTGQFRQEATPARRTYPAGSGVVVAAPAAHDGWVFDAWVVEGQTQASRQRHLALELRGDTELTARYRPWGSGRSVATVTVVSLPDAGVPVEVCVDGVYLPSESVTDADLQVLTGEVVQLAVPSRTSRWVFENWVVDGTTLFTSGPALELRVAGDVVVLAEYALLGDMNGDGQLDKFDVDAFVTALIDPEGFAQQFPGVNRVQRGDVSGDGALDALDVEQFVDLMVED